MDELDALYLHYRKSLANKREELQRAWSLISEGRADEKQIAHLLLLLHRLAGSSGTYGYPHVSSATRHLEKSWRDWLETAAEARVNPRRICLRQAARWDDLMQLLQEEAASEAPHPTPDR